MTESFDFDAKKRSFRIGIDDYMIKPIDLDELLLRVETLLIQTRITKSHKIDNALWGTLVDYITVYEDRRKTVTFRDGTTI